MDIIKFNGNKKYFLALAKEEGQLLIVFAQPKNIEMNCENEDIDCRGKYGEIIYRFTKNTSAKIEIPLISNNENIIKIFAISNEQAFNTVSSILNSILGD